MNNRTLFYLLILAILAMAILFVIRLIPFAESLQPERYLQRGDVQGSAVVRQGQPYTLNFEQQNGLIDLLNQSIPVGKEPFKANPNMPYTKIIIYRFHGEPLELTPIDFDGKDLIYSAPAWNPSGYMRDVSEGQLNQLLEKAYGS